MRNTYYACIQINISNLQEFSWYYLCIEWENFNRHNETTGTDCRIYRLLCHVFKLKHYIVYIIVGWFIAVNIRTLDRLGKGSDTTVQSFFSFRIFSNNAKYTLKQITALEATDVSSQIFQFLVKVFVNFPMRFLILFLKHNEATLK